MATTDPALWADTKDARAKLGPLLTYDPQHLLDTPARLRWSPTSGCEDIAVAAERAAALLTPVRPSSVLDSAVADSATTLLRCWLHAAAVDGRPFRQLHRWAHTSGAAHEPVRVLRTNRKASAGQAGELESVLTAHAERREMAQELVSRTLACLSSIHIRDACNPARSDALLLESFIDEGERFTWQGNPSRIRGPLRVRCRCSSRSSPTWSSAAAAWPNGHPPVGSTHHSPSCCTTSRRSRRSRRCPASSKPAVSRGC